MNTFYASGTGAVGARLNLREEDARHARTVMRMKPGETVYLVDETEERFLAELETVEAGEVSARILEKLDSHECPVSVTLFQGLPKADKLEWIVQKGTELGLKRVCAVSMERSVVRVDEKDGARKQERLDRIAREATKQCKRAQSPEIILPMSMKQCLEALNGYDLVLVPWEDAHSRNMKQAYAEHPEAKNIALIIGPEGGMSAEEVRQMQLRGAIPVTLGPRILRTETAAIASVTLAMMLWGDL